MLSGGSDDRIFCRILYKHTVFLPNELSGELSGDIAEQNLSSKLGTPIFSQDLNEEGCQKPLKHDQH